MRAGILSQGPPPRTGGARGPWCGPGFGESAQREERFAKVGGPRALHPHGLARDRMDEAQGARAQSDNDVKVTSAQENSAANTLAIYVVNLDSARHPDIILVGQKNQCFRCQFHRPSERLHFAKIPVVSPHAHAVVVKLTRTTMMKAYSTPIGTKSIGTAANRWTRFSGHWAGPEKLTSAVARITPLSSELA